MNMSNMLTKPCADSDFIGRLHCKENNQGPFKLYCDSLRPTEFLLHKGLGLVGVVDWEFTNALPMDFACSSPHWLLLDFPGFSPDDLVTWAKKYDARLPVFLRTLREVEKASGDAHNTLSSRMKASWETGDFWITLGARSSFDFDAIFWRYLAPRFYGTRDSSQLMETHLSDDDRADMEASMWKWLEAGDEDDEDPAEEGSQTKPKS